MTEENSEFEAITYGLANEKQRDWRNQQTERDRDMDDWNNACGIGAGNDDPDSPSCEDKCDTLLKNGILDTNMSDGAGRGYWY